MPSTSRSAQPHVFPLIIAGGCFLNFDRLHPPIDEQMRWLREAGFKDVKCFVETRTERSSAASS